MSSPYYMTRSQVSAERNWREVLTLRQEFSNRIIGLNANVDDLETRVYQNKAVLDERFDELKTAANDCEHQLREHQRKVDNAQRRFFICVLFLFCVLTCIVTCIGFGWVFYTEAVAAQARADYLKRLWPVHAFFMRDRVMTVSWAQYYCFKAWFS